MRYKKISIRCELRANVRKKTKFRRDADPPKIVGSGEVFLPPEAI
jgi:hypothetical protein